jgi:outer membrane receptor protein involved in Fe transport
VAAPVQAGFRLIRPDIGDRNHYDSLPGGRVARIPCNAARRAVLPPLIRSMRAQEIVMKTNEAATKKNHGTWLALLVGLIAPLLLFTAPALAQRVTATIWGKIVSDSGPAPQGTTIVAAHVDTGVEVSDTIRPDGSYVLTGVAPGQHLLTVTPPGGQEVMRLVSVGVGQTVALDIDLAKAWQDGPGAETIAGAEIIEVVGQLAESRTSEVATNVSREQLENLPQNNRNFLNFAALAPGVRLSTDPFRQEISSGAVGASQTNVFIDGISLKNSITQGGAVGTDASRGSPFPQLAVAGFRVLTQNFKAEYEQAGSAIISAITRSGGNEFHSELFSAFQNKSLVANDYFAQRNDQPKPEYARYQMGGAVSGPIVKDELFFFGSYEGNYQDRANSVTLGNSDYAGRFGEYEGTYVSPFREHLAFGKLTWNPAAGEIVDLSASLRRETDIRNFGGQTSYENAENVRNNVFTSALRYQYSLERVMNEFTFQYLDSQFNPTALNSDQVGLEYQGVIKIGGRDTTQDIVQRALTLRNDISFTGLEWQGQHLVKTGVKLSFQGYKIDKSLFGNPIFRFREDPANNLDFDVPFEAQYGVGDSIVSARNTQFGVFLQDDWQLTPKLTLNLGVRWDVESNPINNDYETPADVRTAAEELAAIVEPMNGRDFFDVDNYVTDGTQRSVFLGAIQPRLGAAYDLRGDQRTVFFGGAGRYYDRTLFNYAADELLRLQYAVRTFRFSRDGSPRDGAPTIAFQPEYLSAGALDALIASGTAPNPEIFLIENDTRPLHTDQFSIGVRQQVGAVSASLTLNHSRSENGLGFYPANRQATGNRDWIPTPGNFGNVIISADDRSSRFTGIYVTVDKPYSKLLSTSGIQWGASLAYTFGVARERGDEFNFDYATIKDSPITPTGSDERHRVVASGIVGLPWDTRLSTLISLGTGLPFTIADASEGFGPGQFVLRRNAGRDDEIFEFAQVDLRLAKDFELQKQRISAFAEVFNLFNTKNFAGYNGFIPPSPEMNPDFGNPSYLIGPTRSLQFGLGYKF